jgi:hypothetical protein
MTERRLKTVLAFLIVAGHVLVVSIVIGTFVFGGLSFGETITSVALILPLFAGYTSAVVAFVIREKTNTSDSTPQIRMSFIVLSLFLPCVFFLVLIGMVIMQSFHVGFANFEQFTIALGTVDGIFGVYVGQFIHSLFLVKSY